MIKNNKKIIAAVVGIIAIGAIVICYFLTPSGVVYKENIATEVISFGVDDLSGWAVYDIYDSDRKNEIQISEIDIANNRQMQSEFIPSTLFNRAMMYPQGDKTILFVDQENSVDTYRLENNVEPVLLDSIKTSSYFFDEPKIWGNQIYYLGETDDGNKALQIVADGESTIIDLKTLADFGAIIEDVDWYSSFGSNLPFIEIDTYLDEKIMMLPILNEQGQFEYIARQGSTNNSTTNLSLELMKQYYGEKIMISPEKQTDGTYLFAKGTGSQITHPNADMLFSRTANIDVVEIENQAIYNVEVLYLAEDKVLIMGTNEIAPTSTKQNYLFDQKTDKLQTLNEEFNQARGNANIHTLDIYTQNQYIYIQEYKKISRFDMMTNTSETILAQQILKAEIREDKTRTMRFIGTIQEIMQNRRYSTMIVTVLIITLSILFTLFGLPYLLKIWQKKRQKILDRSVELPGEVVKTSFTGTSINSMPQILITVRFMYEGKTLERDVKTLIAPGQAVMPGMGIGIAYDVKKDKIMILKNGEVAGHEAEAILKEAFVTIIAIQKSGYLYEQSEAVILTVKSRENKESQIVTLEAKSLPYSEGEKIEIAEVNGRVTILSRSSRYTMSQRSIRRDMETITGKVVDFTMTDITILGKNLYTFRTTIEKDDKTMIMESADFLPLNIGIIEKNMPMQVNIDKKQLEQRLDLQNEKQAAAIVETVTLNGDAFGVSPFVTLSVKLVDTDEKYTIAETIPVWRVPNINDKVWIGYNENKKIATIINDIN